MISRGDGDGWTRCALGHRHWGLYGAAGLLLWHGDAVLLQHRALWSHHGGTWGILGGARNSGETADGPPRARRGGGRARPALATPSPACYVDDHGGWSYTTVIGRADGGVRAHRAHGRDHRRCAGCASTRLTTLPLHPGFAATWEKVREIG